MGGIIGGISYILKYLSSFFIKSTSLISDAMISGIIFICVGLSIILSMIFSQPLLKDKKNLLFIGSAIGSFIAGIFFPLGIGMYVALIIFPVCLAITIKLADLKGLGVKVLMGGIIGGITGAIIGTLLSIAALAFQHVVPGLQGEVFDITSAALMVAIIIYFWNLGILIGVSKWKVTP